jgi:hypothetical protein
VIVKVLVVSYLIGLGVAWAVNSIVWGRRWRQAGRAQDEAAFLAFAEAQFDTDNESTGGTT